MSFGEFARIRSAAPRQATVDGSSSILVIDDDQRIRQAIELNLGRRHSLRLCTSGEEALRNLDEDIAVILLDLKMPNADGFEVLRQIRQKSPSILVIIYSAYHEQMVADAILSDKGPTICFEKNHEVGPLLAAIEDAIARRQEQRSSPTARSEEDPS